MPETEPQNQPTKAETQQGSSLKQKAIRGTVWTLFGYGGSQVLRLGSNLILTRLLVPEVFGLMALVQTFQTGISLFSDIGIRLSIIQNKRGEDPVFLNTAWTLNIIRGCWVWFVCTLAAWPLSRLYEEPRLLWLLPIVAVTSIVNAFQSNVLATLSRKMALGKLTRFELVSQIVGLTVMIIFAWFNRSIWAIVAGMLCGSLFRMIWSHRLDPAYSNRFAWDKDALKELISFGKWILVSTVMSFFALQADRLILGKLFPLEMLGIYTIAVTFAEIPKRIVDQISNQVLFPAFSQQTDIPRQILRAKILKKRWLMLVLTVVALTFMVCFGDLIVLLLYDQRYEAASWMLPIIALGIWPLVLCRTIEKVLYAFGKPLYSAIGNFLKILYMFTILPLGFYKMGLLGAVIVIAFNDIPFYVPVMYGLSREKMTVFYQDIQATALLIGLIAFVLAVRYILGFGLPINLIL